MTDTDYYPEGRMFEDFAPGQVIAHATPRTVTDGDVAVYQALYGGRQAVVSSAPFAEQLGYRGRPLDDWLVFHIVFGKTVPDISRHAMANLGYANGRFVQPVYAGDTLSAHSTVLGVRENKSGETGLVMVETQGRNQNDEVVLSYQRWVMVKKRDAGAAAPTPVWPQPAPFVAAADVPPPVADFSAWDDVVSGSPRRFADYQIGEMIEHGDGTTLEEAEHMLATRSFQNTAAVHFDAQMQATSRFGKRLIYGGHIISHARAMSFNGLENAACVLALNGGTHAAPAFAGDTIYAASQIIDKAQWPGRNDVGALRVAHFVSKNDRAAAAHGLTAEGKPADGIILHLDVWLAMPR